MSLRSQLEEVLPELLPMNPREAIKGTELIRLVRMKLGEEYSDASLRYHFSFMAAEPDSRIAKVERGQGYYLRVQSKQSDYPSRGLLPLFLGEDSQQQGADVMRSRALALVVRQYDTTGRGVFVFSPGECGPSWNKPELAVVDWPEGEWDASSLIFDKSALERRRMVGAPIIELQSVCVAYMPRPGEYRREFFRALSTSCWSQTGELVIVGEIPDDADVAELRRLAAEFGVGVVCMEISEDRLAEMPGAEEIFRADDTHCETLLVGLEPVRLAAGRAKPRGAEMGEVVGGEFGALFDWLAACLERGRVEEYEFRVSSY
ncbi:MAG: hypothetical protein RR553_04330 [Akkermansia sp.]